MKVDNTSKDFVCQKFPAQSRLPVPLEHEYYHGPDNRGYFILSTKPKHERWRDRPYKLDSLPFVMEFINPKLDSYISQAEFFRRRRLIVNLWRINVCWAELDTYKTSRYSGKSPEAQAEEVVNLCWDEEIPMPSLIVYSGQGIHVKWLLSKPLPQAALSRWNAVQRALTAKFSQFGSDRGSIDGSRVLRLVQTVNTKTGDVCQVIWLTGNISKPVRYSFDTLADSVLFYTREEYKRRQQEQQRAAAERKEKYQEIIARGSKNLAPFDATQLNWDRYNDITQLAYFRYGADGVEEGYRDKFLFLASCFMAWAVNPPRLYEEIKELGRQFAPGFRENEVRGYAGSVYRRAKQAFAGQRIEWEGKSRDTRYRFQNQTLLEWLEITPEEERFKRADGHYLLRTIISRKEAERRRRERDRKRDTEKRRAAGALDRKLVAAERKRKAQELFSQGKRIAEIAKIIGISYESARLYVRK